VNVTALASGGILSVAEQKVRKESTSSSQTPYRSLPAKAESSLIPLLVLSPADPLRWALPGPRSGLWKPWGARVVHALSLERFFGSLLLASVSALQASPRTSNCGGANVPTARGCYVAAGLGRGKGASGTPPPTVYVSSVRCRGRHLRRPLVRFPINNCPIRRKSALQHLQRALVFLIPALPGPWPAGTYCASPHGHRILP
jgi:hypothetical protein